MATLNTSSQFTLSVRRSSLLPSTIERGMVIMSRILVLDFPASAQLKFPVDIVIKSTPKAVVSRRRRMLLGYQTDVPTHGRRILEHLTDRDAKVCDCACVRVECNFLRAL